MKELPRYIFFSTAELTLLFAQFYKDAGGILDPNLETTPDLMSSAWTLGNGHVIYVDPDKNRAARQSDQQHGRIDKRINNIQELLDLFVEPIIKVGEYEVTFDNPAGVKVGCTFVPWKTIDEIIARKPKK